MKLQYIILDFCHKLTLDSRKRMARHCRGKNIHVNVHEQEIFTTLNLCFEVPQTDMLSHENACEDGSC